jgi:hypothetical protein
MEQTAVEWLAEQIKEYDYAPITNTDEYAIVIPVWIFNDKLNQAKAIEKENMHKCASFWRGKENEIEKPMFDEYYNETYKK